MIIGIFGNLSSGKTVTAIQLCYNDYKKEDRTTISNIHLNFPHVPVDIIGLLKKAFSSNIEEKTSYFFEKNILLDEAHNILDARKSTSNLNTMFTMFVTQIGKMDCNLIMTSQMFSSQIDLRVRELCNMIIYCERVNSQLEPIFFMGRKVKDKIFIKLSWELNKWGLEGKLSHLNPKGEMFFDPSPYYDKYDTREIVLIDREKFNSKSIKKMMEDVE